MTRLALTTANTPGAVAILQLHGGGAADVLRQLTGRDAWPDRHIALCRFGDIDEGLAVYLEGGQAFLPVDRRSRMDLPDQACGPVTGRNACPPCGVAQLMPHGGPRVVQKLIEHLTRDLGCAYDASPDPREIYPEAQSPVEADMLDTIARAASPAAIDLLAKQPDLWAILLKQDGRSADQIQSIIDGSRTLDQLIHPPTVVVVGPANAGKSTLTNALLGKAVSLVADLPGTTRDWVGALVELAASGQARDAVAVNWLDTPGLRDSDDPIEQRAIALARNQIAHADVLIAMRGADQDWPEAGTLPRTPDLWVVNKVDDAARSQATNGRSRETPLRISAIGQLGLEVLQSAVINALGLGELSGDQPWAFSTALRDICAIENAGALKDYLGV